MSSSGDLEEQSGDATGTSLLANWDRSAGLFENLRSGSGSPRLRIAQWIVWSVGGLLVFLRFVAVEFVRETTVGVVRFVREGFEFWADAAGILVGGGAEVPVPGNIGTERFVPGIASLATGAFENATQSLDGPLAFIVAFVIVFALVIIFDVVREGVSRLG